ncbi:MAG: ADP-ribosylglycohydrolase family protein [Lentisphaerae bacterium]|nr:ADP-ribosylglycohydrolase family protein [Lentisphaerota bacterium]MBT4818784.1 ADP-ribosylglycohydrolase family protein [Lentisphaerota bacterium]MBT5608393.1 ADP-ribosylglycohydrolase family protein [Lentisphaerota bacterium]MBT7054987.1 ADP-ribosylglycohydrolase family protein [Lentisphaerota bacterium]MBT7844816.1 ADP-ribosylglycohydrolase family protein [Lentisphaerota bacterium]
MARLDWNTYFTKTLGCWMGKNSGGTLGGPVEGRREILTLDWYPKVQAGGIPNDDLEVQLVWLHALETRGQCLTAEDLAAEWLDHYLPNWDEYGFGKTNVRKGLLPPLSGAFNNAFGSSMGCPIRSEIWACIAPGLPLIAARLARADAIVDHTDESVYAEMLFAVIESAAYLTEDRDELMKLGLAAIPDDCRTSQAVRIMIETWNATGSWGASRQAVLDLVGNHANFTDAPQNIAFTLLGWYSAPTDFGQAICDAVNCGFDTDCTGATLGAILGIAWGAERLPERWMEPLGDGIAIIEERTRIHNQPKTLQELTERTAAIAVGSLAQLGYVFGPGRELDLVLPAPEELRQQMQASGLWSNARDTAERRFHHGRILVRYPDGPVLAPGATNHVVVTLQNETERRMEGPVAAAGLTPGLNTVTIAPEAIDIAPGESSELKVNVELASESPVRCHADLAVAIQAEGISPWSFTVSFVRPMFWHMEIRPVEAFDGLGGSSPAVEGERIAVTGNLLPLAEVGTWVGRTRVLNPSAYEREVKVCSPSNNPVRVWLNGECTVDNPGAELMRPSYHAGPATHHGMGVLKPGWNDLVGVWRIADLEGESHLFLTEPSGKGWGDLVFEP